MMEKTMAILAVDDEDGILKCIKRLVEGEGYACLTAQSGFQALSLLGENAIDVVVTDVAMPGMDGIELTRQINENHDADIIMMTGYFKDLSYEAAIRFGASDFIKKPFAAEEFLIRLKRVLNERRDKEELNSTLARMTRVLDGVIQSLSSTVEARDPYTSGHQKRVARLAEAIAGHMNLSRDRIETIGLAGIIHDLGKVAIPSEILSKPSKLSDIEFSLIQTHSQVGYEIIKNIPFDTPIAQIVRQHHEKLDGSGYPGGLKGDEILLESRIMTVADVVEAMASHRPYRPSLGLDLAIREISDTQKAVYDPEVVKACIAVLKEMPLID